MRDSNLSRKDRCLLKQKGPMPSLTTEFSLTQCCLTDSHTMTPFDAPGNKPFENAVGKGETARNEQYLLVQVFSTRLDNFMPFSSNLELSSANSFSLEESKICRLVMG